MSRQCDPNWIEAYIQYTQFLEAHTKFHLWTGLTMLASAVCRNVYIDRKYFKIFPNLYTGIIGPTGDGKTTAGNAGMTILRKVPNLEVITEKTTSWYLLELFDTLTKSNKDCACTIYAPEMKSLLGDLNKTELVTLLTSYYTCPDETEYRTKGGGSLKFKNVCVNLLACSTPEWLTTGTSTDDISGGFTGRFVYAFEDTQSRSIAFPEDYVTTDILDIKKDLIADLIHIATLKGTFIITDQAKAEYTLWYVKRKEECTDERLLGYFSRKRDLVLKVAMLLSLSKDDSLVIDESILHITWKLLEQLEAKMSDVFSGVVSDPALKYKDAVLNYIRKQDNKIATRSEVLIRFWNNFDGLVLDRIINNLEEAGMLKRGMIQRGGKSQMSYQII